MIKNVETKTTLTEGAITLTITESRSGSSLEVTATYGDGRPQAQGLALSTHEAHTLMSLLREHFTPAELMKGDT